MGVRLQRSSFFKLSRSLLRCKFMYIITIFFSSEAYWLSFRELFCSFDEDEPGCRLRFQSKAGNLLGRTTYRSTYVPGDKQMVIHSHTHVLGGAVQRHGIRSSRGLHPMLTIKNIADAAMPSVPVRNGLTAGMVWMRCLIMNPWNVDAQGWLCSSWHVSWEALYFGQ